MPEPPPPFPDTTNPERRPPSLLEAALALVASVLHDWRRAALLVGVAAAGLVGFVVYDGRERLLAALAQLVAPPPAAILRARVPAIAHELRVGLEGVRAVLVWTVDAEANRRALVGLDADDATAAALAAVLPRLRLGVPLLRVQASGAPNDVNALVLGAINGVVPCGPPGWPAWNRTDERPPPFPIAAVCLAGIPPEPGTLVGLLEVVFDHAPEPALLDALRPVLWHAAARLAGRDDDAAPPGG